MPLKQRKQIFEINATELKMPTGRRLFTEQTEDLNSGLPRNKSREWQNGGLEPGI